MREVFNWINETTYDVIAFIRLRLKGGSDVEHDDVKIFATSKVTPSDENDEAHPANDTAAPGQTIARSNSKLSFQRSILSRKTVISAKPLASSSSSTTMAPIVEGLSSEAKDGQVVAFQPEDGKEDGIPTQKAFEVSSGSDSSTVSATPYSSSNSSAQPTSPQHTGKNDVVKDGELKSNINNRLRNFSFDSSSGSDEDRAGKQVKKINSATTESVIPVHGSHVDKQSLTLRGHKPHHVDHPIASGPGLTSDVVSPAVVSGKASKSDQTREATDCSDSNNNSSSSGAGITTESRAISDSKMVVSQQSAGTRGRRRSLMGTGTVSAIKDKAAAESESLERDAATNDLDCVQERFRKYRNRQFGTDDRKVSPEELEAQNNEVPADKEDFSSVFLFGSPHYFYR